MAQADTLDYNQQQSAGARMRESKVRSEEVKEEQQKMSLRQRVASAKKALNIKEKAKKKIDEKITAPAKMGTNWLLRWAWGVLIPSFGLSLVYINMHLFLRWVFPSAFCKLGEEWQPKIMGTGEHSSKNVAGTAFGIVEVVGLLMLDLILFFLILAILGLISMIMSWLGKGFWSSIWGVVEAIYNLGWNGVSVLVDLFGDVETSIGK